MASSWAGGMRALILLLAVAMAPAAWAIKPSPAKLDSLAASARWQALLHINHGATLRDIGESYADDPDFFFAHNGARDPRAELRATIDALRPSGSRARCRFPARYRFVAEHLRWHEARPLEHCREYKQWRAKMPIGQLVMVFPAAYLNSPSSMFGHTLMRLDGEKKPEAVMLSRAINFGADSKPDENSVFYIWRGLAGGYRGFFSVTPYAKKIRQYSFLENRDIWEYRLNLDEDELDWVVRHLWELRDIDFDYFYFDENCSFRLLELLQVGRPSAPLTPGFRVAALPVDTVRALYRADLVAGRDYRPSKEKKLKYLAQKLSGDELTLAKALKDNPDLADTRRFQQVPPARRYLVAQVAYRALRLHNRIGPRKQSVANHSLALLRVVQRNPAPDLAPVDVPSAPEIGHGTKMATLAGGRQDGADFAEVGFRLTYHDLLDPLAGFPPGAGIEGLNVRLRASQAEGLKLENLDFVKIRSLAPRETFIKPISWFIHSGLEQAPTRDDRSLGLFLEGGPGATWQYGSIMPYVFADGRVESVSGQEPGLAVGAGPEIGAAYLTNELQLGLRARWLYFAPGFYRLRTRITADIPLSTNNAVRGECSRNTWRDHSHDACRLEFRHYF